MSEYFCYTQNCESVVGNEYLSNYSREISNMTVLQFQKRQIGRYRYLLNVLG